MEPKVVSEFEQLRLKNIQRNKELLASLSLKSKVAELSTNKSTANRRKRSMKEVIAEESRGQPQATQRQTRSMSTRVVIQTPHDENAFLPHPGTNSGVLQQTLTTQTSEEQPSENNDELVDSTLNTFTSHKRGRGPNKPWNVWGQGNMIEIEWSGNGEPMGENGNKMMNHLGTYVRNGTWFPLTNPWIGTSDVVLDQIWKEVKENTNAPDTFQPFLNAKLHEAWRKFKHKVKNDYYRENDANTTDEERLANVPPQVEADQWPTLVRFWGLEGTKKEAQKNSQNRGFLCAHPRLGRTTIAEVTARLKKDGKATDKISIWKACREKDAKLHQEDGTIDIWNKIEEKISQLPEEERGNIELRNKLFEGFFGKDKHGRVRLMGAGNTPRAIQTSLEVKRIENEFQQTIEELQHNHQSELNAVKESVVEIVAATEARLEAHFEARLSELIEGNNAGTSVNTLSSHSVSSLPA